MVSIGPREGFQKSPKPPNLGWSIDHPLFPYLITPKPQKIRIPMIFQIMSLKAFDMHKCIFCPCKSIRKNLKRYLTSAGKKGPRCPALKKVIPCDVWTNNILPHYSENAPMPNIDGYKKHTQIKILKV